MQVFSENTCPTKDCGVALTPEKREYVEGFYWCLDCARQIHAHQQIERAKIIDARITDLEREGLVDVDFRRRSFEHSNTAEEAENAQAWECARAWRAGLGDGVENAYIFGAVGVGKTYMAKCLLRRALEQDYTIGICTAAQFTALAKLAYNVPPIFQRWHAVQVLLFDDVTSGDWNRNTVRKFWELMDQRLNRNLITIMTCDHTIEDLRATMYADVERSGGPDTGRIRAALDRMKPASRKPVLKIELRGSSRR